GIWQDQDNCLILSNYQTSKDIEHIFKNKKIDSISFKSINNENIKTEIIDAPINEFNRLLNKVLSLNYEKR
ncbi:MAG: hypothetical protein KDD45_14690, partial [Bdellovibrionales bacterium]|nr:hypothetical protein [Bdellovibrionales bacterium]